MVTKAGVNATKKAANFVKNNEFRSPILLKYEHGRLNSGIPIDQIKLQKPIIKNSTVNPFKINRTHSITGRTATKKVETLIESMKKEGWQGSQIDVFLHNGEYYVLDGHHRVAAAKIVNIDVPINIIIDLKAYNKSWKTVEELINGSCLAGPDKLRLKMSFREG
ncbi:MAG: Rhs family protein [Francisellaceae bacterium]|nr:Rhs family protein [Francisellaceae bacterium]